MKKDTEIHQKALGQYVKIQSALRDERLQCLQDRRFYSIAGAQWEGPLQQQFENKPKLEINKIHLAVIRIINEYRNNRITANFLPKDGAQNKLTDVCSDLYRACEFSSNAEEAYDNAFEEAVGGGFGAWRLRADYENDEDLDDDKQTIFIEPIYDADASVFFDLDAKRQDKSDANFAFVVHSMTWDAFNDEYDDDPNQWDVATWPHIIQQRVYDWLTPNIVYVAEYYVKEQAEVEYVIYKGLSGEVRKIKKEELDEDKDQKSELKATGFKRTGTRRIKETKVHKYLMCGNSILSDEGYIAGTEIPIVPVYGKRWFIDNVERCMGHVRLCKDPQRLKNMQTSKLAEISALSTVEKPIFVAEQMSGHAQMWADDNIINYPYLLINSMTDNAGNSVPQGPAGYTKVPNVPPAMAALLQQTEQDIQDILGNQEAGEEMQANLSGVAVELIQQKLDMQTFIYISNMAKAVKRSGQIWLSMAKEIYVEEGRKLRSINSTGEHSSVTLMQPGIDESTGVPQTSNDLSEANFDVDAVPGPTSASKRAAIVRALGGLLQLAKDPQTGQILTSLIMMNMEGEGIDDVRQYYRKQLVSMGIIQPTPEEQQQLMQAQQNQKPDANTLYLQAAADQAQTEAMQNRADAVLTIKKAELTQAQTQKTLHDIGAGQVEQVFRGLEVLGNQAMQGAQMQDMQAQQALQQSSTPATKPVDLPKQEIAGAIPPNGQI